MSIKVLAIILNEIVLSNLLLDDDHEAFQKLGNYAFECGSVLVICIMVRVLLTIEDLCVLNPYVESHFRS